ncbi:MAG: hypothetical protein CMM99_06240 [Rickettsiales bacterium]|nr:hypothetical protein [Rickettsiales bacterium]
MKVSVDGDKKNDLFLKIKNSFDNAMAQKRKVNDFILNLNGLSGRKFRSMLNNLIEICTSPRYLEIGTWHGSTACSVCYKNTVDLTCIDNWSQNFIADKNPMVEFNKNIKNVLNESSNLNLINKDFRDVNYNNIGKHNIYLYDGPHHLKDHYDGIRLVQPALEDDYILIVDDWNWKQVRAGTLSAVDHLNLKIISQLEIKTTCDDSSALITGENSDWHQGCCFFIIKK